MYYPKSQIIENLSTNGDEYKIQATNKPYKGYYFQVSNNQRFTGKNPDDKPNNLLVEIRDNVEYGSTLEQPKKAYWSPSYKFLQKQRGNILPSAPQPPNQSKPQPTSQDYNNGLFNRYFLYKTVDKSTIEVDIITYTQYIDKSPGVQINIFTPIQITWALTGEEKKVSKSNYNSVRLTEQKQQIYGFSNYFNKKYTQYYRYGKNENLYSNGKELRYTKNKKPYMGYYHIHPEKGPMVGRQHKEESHDYLEFVSTGSILDPLPPTTQSGSYVEPTREINISIGGSGGY